MAIVEVFVLLMSCMQDADVIILLFWQDSISMPFRSWMTFACSVLIAGICLNTFTTFVHKVLASDCFHFVASFVYGQMCSHQLQGPTTTHCLLLLLQSIQMTCNVFQKWFELLRFLRSVDCLVWSGHCTEEYIKQPFCTIRIQNYLNLSGS